MVLNLEYKSREEYMFLELVKRNSKYDLYIIDKLGEGGMSHQIKKVYVFGMIDMIIFG